MAGTTVADNNNVAETLQEALQAFGCVVSVDDVNKVMGLPKPIAIGTLLQQVAGNAPGEGLVSEVFDLFEEKMIQYYRVSEDVREQDGASEVFLRLKENGVE